MESPMSVTSALYYEAHVTIEPVFDARLAEAKAIAEPFQFRVADLLMKKREADTEERSKHDTFMTGHGKRYDDIEGRLVGLIQALDQGGFKVWRYKIEDTILDSRIDDRLDLLRE
jgi:hypothetical protein